MILGLDAGNYETKVCNEYGTFSFLSNIGEYRERKIKESFGKDDIVWEYQGEKGFAGSLAMFESEFGGTIKGETKANSDAILRILIALHIFGDTNNKIVVGQPIISHDDEEKNKIKEKLIGDHDITINGTRKLINIERVEVAPEGLSAILSNPSSGYTRVIDVGSGTTNFATLFNLKRIDKDSFTEQIGTETTRTKNPKEMARKIYRTVSATWNQHDKIFLTGGGATLVHEHLKEYLYDCRILKPKLGNTFYGTKYGNAVGFYKIAERLYSE